MRTGDASRTMGDSARRILLIESSEPVASQIASSLPHADLDLQRATDLISALALLRSSPFDAVVVNLSLPDSSGMNTLIAVRNECPDAPIVVLGDDENPATGSLA